MIRFVCLVFVFCILWCATDPNLEWFEFSIRSDNSIRQFSRIIIIVSINTSETNRMVVRFGSSRTCIYILHSHCCQIIYTQLKSSVHFNAFFSLCYLFSVAASTIVSMSFGYESLKWSHLTQVITRKCERFHTRA